MIARILLVVAAVSFAGCGVAYTSIRQEADGTYVVTGMHQGFFRTSGKVYRCKPEGARMKCQETASN
jgi:hypothetical protein